MINTQSPLSVLSMHGRFLGRTQNFGPLQHPLLVTICSGAGMETLRSEACDQKDGYHTELPISCIIRSLMKTAQSQTNMTIRDVAQFVDLGVSTSQTRSVQANWRPSTEVQTLAGLRIFQKSDHRTSDSSQFRNM